MARAERILTILASLITLFNFLLTPVGVTKIGFSLGIVTSLQSMTVSTRSALLLILEASLAYIFGFLFMKACSIMSMIRFLLYVIIAVVSAWISIFNIEQILMGVPINSFGLSMGCFTALGVVAGITGWSILIHSTETPLCEFGELKVILVIQLVAFVLLSFQFVADTA